MSAFWRTVIWCAAQNLFSLSFSFSLPRPFPQQLPTPSLLPTPTILFSHLLLSPQRFFPTILVGPRSPMPSSPTHAPKNFKLWNLSTRCSRLYCFWIVPRAQGRGRVRCRAPLATARRINFAKRTKKFERLLAHGFLVRGAKFVLSPLLFLSSASLPSTTPISFPLLHLPIFLSSLLPSPSARFPYHPGRLSLPHALIPSLHSFVHVYYFSLSAPYLYCT